VADGVIVGSAIVRRITGAVEAGMSRDDLVESVTAFVCELVAATHEVGQ
jgi:tryptophan synthase alpha subunit